MMHFLCVDWSAVAPWASPIIGGVITFFVSLYVIDTNKKIADEQKLNDVLRSIINRGIDFPELEDKEFIKKWENNQLESRDRVRYEMYCINWFNFLYDLCKFYCYNKDKVENVLNVKEVVRQHKSWWQCPDDDEFANVEGYSKEFREFINSNYLK